MISTIERERERERDRERERETSKADVRTQTDERRSRNPEWPPRPLSRLLTDKEESAREKDAVK